MTMHTETGVVWCSCGMRMKATLKVSPHTGEQVYRLGSVSGMSCVNESAKFMMPMGGRAEQYPNGSQTCRVMKPLPTATVCQSSKGNGGVILKMQLGDYKCKRD